MYSRFDPRTQQFYRELPQAKRAEKYVAKLLGGELAKEGDVSADVLVGSSKIEVKYDKLSKRTGRVAVELESYGNNRGINRSQSNFYFIICYDKTWSEIVEGIKKVGWWVGCMIETSLLKEMVDSIPYPIVQGGDNKATTMKLIPVEDLIARSDHIYPIKK